MGNTNLDDRLDEGLARLMAERAVADAWAVPSMTDAEWERLKALNETMRSDGKVARL